MLVLHGAKSLNRRPLAAAAAAVTGNPPRRKDDLAEASRLSEARPIKARPEEAHALFEAAGEGLEASGQEGARGHGAYGHAAGDEEGEEACPLSPSTLSSHDHGGGGGGGGGHGGGGRGATHDAFHERGDACEVGRGRWGSIFTGEEIFTEDGVDGGDCMMISSDMAVNDINVGLAGVGSGGAIGSRDGGGSGGGGGGGGGGRRAGVRGGRLQDDASYGEDYVLVRNKLEGFFSAERRARLERAGNLDRLEDYEFMMPSAVQLEKASCSRHTGRSTGGEVRST